MADRYAEGLAGVVGTPTVVPGATSAWANYTVTAPRRDRLAAELRQAGIATAVYYARPLHRQTAFRRYPAAPGGLPVAERMADEVLSLPMHPYLDPADQDRVDRRGANGVGPAPAERVGDLLLAFEACPD